MSTTIDQQVVEMRFDNRHFEKNVQTSMTTLDKLKQSLNMPGATKGLENVNAAVNRVNFNGFHSGIEAVQVKFSHLQATVQHQIDKIVDSTISAGKRMASALTIDPIKTGFSEYETQINAVQTILANTSAEGTNLQEVNAALDTLNTYADKTIYNFTEMTRNIGTFTAAGVGLDDSVSAIQGIANLAAISGSTSQQASSAMYQLSQALAAGRVSLMDWNSVVNAGMGGQVFQDALKNTAKSMGIVVDESKSFRESISGSDSWLSSEVLIKTLNQFTMAAEEGTEQWEIYKKSLMEDGYSEKQAVEILKMANTATDAATKVKTFTQLWDTLKEAAQSGWTQSWEIIVGDFEEAKESLTKISEVIGNMLGDSATNRNSMLAAGLSTGWKQLLAQGIADEEGYKESIKNVAKEHGVAFDEMIKKAEEAGGSFEDALVESLKNGDISADMLGESVTDLADSMRKMTAEERKAAGYTDEHLMSIEKLEAGLKDGSISMDEFVAKMQRPSGRQNIIDALWNSFNGLMSIIKPIKEAFRDIFPAMTGEQLYEITEKFRKLTEKFTISGDTADDIKRTFKGLFALLDIGVKAVSALFNGFGKLVGFVRPAGNSILGFTAGIGDFIVSVNDAIESSDFFNKAVEKIGNFLTPIGEGVKAFAETIKNAFSDISVTASARLEPLTILGEFLKAVFMGLANIIKKVAPVFSSLADEIGRVFGDLVGNVADAIQGSDYNKLFDIFNSGVFAAIGVFVAKFMKSISDITGSSVDFVDGLKDILSGTSDALNAFTGSMKADTLKKISIAIGILAASLFVLSLIDSEKLTGSLAAITIIFAELSAAMTIFTKLCANKGIGKMPVIAATLVGLASALLVLSVALKIMSTMSWNEMAVGLVSISVGLGVLVGALWLLPEGQFNKAAKAIKKMSSALLVFSVAMKILSTMSLDELGVALTATVVGLGALIGATHLLPKDMTGKAAAILVLSGALVILGSALKIMASMSWAELAKSLIVLGGSLLILSKALNSMSDASIRAGSLLVISGALVVLASALQIMSSMSVVEIAKGLVTLGVSMIILVKALNSMPDTLKGAVAIMMISSALLLLTPALKTLGGMPFAEILKGLGAIAGVFVILGVAGSLLEPLTPIIFTLSAAITLLGIGCAAIGAGVFLIGTGITALAAALAAGGTSIVLFVSSLVGLIPYVIEQIGVGIIKLCDVISGSAESICSAMTVIIQAIVDALVTSVPAIADGIFILVSELLNTLVTYTPTIVTALFDFLIGLINAVAEKLPDLIQAGTNLLMKFFEGVINSLKNIDPSVLVNGLLAVGLLTALVTSMALIAALTPAALVGVLGMGAVVTELSLVLAAIGALSQIPGLEWLISESGNFLQTIGSAIGKFIGGIVGGFANGFTSNLPDIATNLSDFMTNIEPFINGAKGIDSSVVSGVLSLAEVIGIMTGIGVLDGLTSWITGGSSLVDMGDDLAEFGPKLKAYADSVTGIDSSAITSSAAAAKSLTELANNLPKSGGLAGLFSGDNDIAEFGDKLVAFGKKLYEYSFAIIGFDPEAVTASANAAAALVELASNIPNEGGVASWFAGDNSIASFADQLGDLGTGLCDFSDAVSGINPENIVAAASAAKALAEMMSHIPNEGGMAAWFTGENSAARFSGDMVSLGTGLSEFSTAIEGINPENIKSAASAAKSIAEMVSYIPNEGGLVAWLTGDNSVANFAGNMGSLGTGLSDFSTAIEGINTENITSAASAAKAIAEMMSYIPNEGGVVAWFTGNNAVCTFISSLPTLGEGLASFSAAVTDINAENISSAASAAKALADMMSVIPNEGGVAAWFTGENAITTFIDALPTLGSGLAEFSNSVIDINPENITAAASAAKALAEMMSVIPNEGGVAAWFTGENAISTFVDALPTLGSGLSEFSASLVDVNPETIKSAASSLSSIATTTESIPSDSSAMISFGDNLVLFGEDLNSYYSTVSAITAETVTASTNAIKSITSAATGLNPETLTAASDGISSLINTLRGMGSITENTTKGFTAAMAKLGEVNVATLVTKFNTAGPKLTAAGQTLITKFVSGANAALPKVNDAGVKVVDKFVAGIDKSKKNAEKAWKSIISSCVTAISNNAYKFSSAGKEVVTGFASGITTNTFKAEAAAVAMAEAALAAAKEALGIQSPSKEFYEAGGFAGLGFVNALSDYERISYNSGYSMASAAKNGLNDAISKVADVVNSDIDTQPTIRPVLDLSDITAGAGTIDSLFSMSPSVGLMANVGSISASMNRNQNGVGNSDIVSAINDLKGAINNISGNTYQIGGITYDDGSNISDAVKSIVRAARVERRI